MAQHDYTIANQGFPAFRSDLNDALAAIVSNNSGATEPTTMFAHQMWVDTAANPSVLKIRNADNDAWITVGTINQTGDTFTLTPAGGVVLPAGTSSLPSLTTTGDLNTGVFFPGADRVGVVTGGTQRLEVTSAGEVLVGGTTEVSSHQALSVQRTNATPVLSTFRNDTSIATGDLLGALQFFGNDTTSNTPTIHAQIYAVASGTHAAGDNPTDLVFGCTNDGSETVAEFARLGQAGTAGRFFNLSQPTLANSQASTIAAKGGTAGTINRLSELGVFLHSGITNCSAYLRLDAEDSVANFLWADNSDILRISTSVFNIGTTGGTVVGTQTSDERLKDISGSVSYGLNEVLALEPIAFTMKDDPSIPKIGFSAQQVQPIVPEAVYDTKECIDGYTENEETKEQIANSDRTKLAMEYTQLIPVLVNAVKELSAKNDALEARIAALENA